MSFRLHGKARLPLNGFPRKFIFVYFWRIYREKDQVPLKRDKKTSTLNEGQQSFDHILQISS